MRATELHETPVGQPEPLRFSMRDARHVGFVVQSTETSRRPAHADVFLEVEPRPGEGLSYTYTAAACSEPGAGPLPTWARDAVEQGALHACLVGGPGGIPLADVAIGVRHVRIGDLRADGRTCFLASYLAMRKAVHLAILECPRIVEYCSHVALCTADVHEAVLHTQLVEAGASEFLRRAAASGRSVWLDAVLPTCAVPALIARCRRLNRFAGAVPMHVEDLGYRAQDDAAAQATVRRLGRPLDWPVDGGDMPRLGSPFPSLPGALSVGRT